MNSVMLQMLAAMNSMRRKGTGSSRIFWVKWQMMGVIVRIATSLLATTVTNDVTAQKYA